VEVKAVAPHFKVTFRYSSGRLEETNSVTADATGIRNTYLQTEKQEQKQTTRRCLEHCYEGTEQTIGKMRVLVGGGGQTRGTAEIGNDLRSYRHRRSITLEGKTKKQIPFRTTVSHPFYKINKSHNKE
jgi:hypothetical protein